ncbi:MAG: hypothetical protein ACK4OM_01600 [Alphaproteobacteria bacterium]
MSKFKVWAKIVSGTVIGASAATIYNYHKPVVAIEHAKNDPKWGLDLAKTIAKNDIQVNDALAVITTASASQFGKEFYNKLTEEGRRSIIAHPYDKQGSGVSVTVTYQLPDGTRQVMLMQKLESRNKPLAGLKGQYHPIGGYTKGAGVEGSIMVKESFAEEEARDAIEDKFLETGKYEASKELSKTEEESVKVDKEYFAKFTEAMEQYFAKKIKTNPYNTPLDPTDVKRYLNKNNIFYNRDYNAIDTARREFLEETGYNGEVNFPMFKTVDSIGEYAINNVANLHTLAVNVIVDLGVLPKEPIVYNWDYKGEREPNSFQANGTEIGKLQWTNIENLENKEGYVYFDGIKVEKAYGTVLHSVVRYLNNEELNKESNGLVPTRNTVDSWRARVAFEKRESELGEFGKEAVTQHKEDKCFAKAIGKYTNLSNPIVLGVFESCKERGR